MQLAHVSPSGLRGGVHAFAARIWLEDDVVVEVLNDQPGIELRIDDEPIQEAV